MSAPPPSPPVLGAPVPIEPLVKQPRRCVPAITDIDELREVIDFFRSKKAFAFDTETVPKDRSVWGDKDLRKEHSVDPLRNRVVWVSLATDGEAVAIPLGHPVGDVLVPRHRAKVTELHPDRLDDRKARPGGVFKDSRYYRTRSVTVDAVLDDPPPQLQPGLAWEVMAPLFMDPDIIKVAHNLKFDIRSMERYLPRRVAEPYVDTIVLSSLIESDLLTHALDQRVKQTFGASYPQMGKDIPATPFSEVAIYAARDAAYTWELYKLWWPQIEKQRLAKVWDLEMDLVPVLADMEDVGFQVDTAAVEKLGKGLTKRMQEIREDLYTVARREWNLNSVDEKGWFCFKVRGHKPTMFTPGRKPSVAKAALDLYARRDKEVAKILEYADLAKTMGTYVDGLLSKADEGERIHSSFKQTGAQTGRISSNSPNLHNIPRTGDAEEKGPKGLIRSSFIAREGSTLLVADYDQIELRVLAALSKEEKMVRVFERGEDPHRATAAQITGKSLDEVTDDERARLGKTINFAIGYGAGAPRVAEQANISKSRAQGVLDDFWAEYSTLDRWQRQVKRDARKRMYVRTLLGRKRVLTHIRSQDEKIRARAERQALNSVIQGTAADILKVSLVYLQHELAQSDTGARIVLQVHDEVVVEAPEECVEEVAELMRLAMVGKIQPFERVPLTTEVKWAHSWDKAK